MTRQEDMAAFAFVTGAMVNAGATLAKAGGRDPSVATFDVPGMGRVRVHVEAVHTDHEQQEADNGGNEHEA